MEGVFSVKEETEVVRGLLKGACVHQGNKGIPPFGLGWYKIGKNRFDLIRLVIDG